MKKVFFFFVFVLGLYFCIQAQPNNPLSGFGNNYFASVSDIIKDIRGNGLKGTDQASLDYYKKYLHFKGNITPELAKAEYELAKKGKPDAESILKGSKFSYQTKAVLKKIIAVPLKDGGRYYSNLISEILASNIESEEKTMLLQLNDIAYVATTSTGNGIANREPINVPCEDNPALCVVVAGFAGFALGSSICGTPCGAIGAVVFAVVAAISVS